MARVTLTKARVTLTKARFTVDERLHEVDERSLGLMNAGGVNKQPAP